MAKKILYPIDPYHSGLQHYKRSHSDLTHPITGEPLFRNIHYGGEYKSDLGYEWYSDSYVKELLNIKYDSPRWNERKSYYRDFYPEMTENFVFFMQLKLKTFHRGRSAATFTWEDETGREFPTFMKYTLEIMNTKVINYGEVEAGYWTFAKHGQNYSIRPIELDDNGEYNNLIVYESYPYPNIKYNIAKAIPAHKVKGWENEQRA